MGRVWGERYQLAASGLDPRGKRIRDDACGDGSHGSRSVRV